MFQTLSAGKTRHELPGTGALKGIAVAKADWNVTAATSRTADTAAVRIVPLMPRIIGILPVGS
jgi:hypothetical protein